MQCIRCADSGDCPGGRACHAAAWCNPTKLCGRSINCQDQCGQQASPLPSPPPRPSPPPPSPGLPPPPLPAPPRPPPPPCRHPHSSPPSPPPFTPYPPPPLISVDLCGTYHFGCHASIKEYSNLGIDVELTNTDCAADLPLTAGAEKDGYGNGTSLCWDRNYHGSVDGAICGSNPYSINSVITAVAEHACGARPRHEQTHASPYPEASTPGATPASRQFHLRRTLLLTDKSCGSCH